MSSHTEPSSREDRFSHGIHQKATPADKQAYVKYRLLAYERHPQWLADTLSECYADDFRDFKIDDFKLVKTDIRRVLRDLLGSRGVYVSEGRNVFIAEGLFAIVKEKLP